MAAIVPFHVKDILKKLPLDNFDYDGIISQCSKFADQRCSASSIENNKIVPDPLYQDWRFNIICDTLTAFRIKGITKKQIKEWCHLINAIYPWNTGYDIFRQIVNRRFVAFPWIIAMTNEESQVIDAFNIAIKYNIPFCIRGGAHAYEPYSIISNGILIDQSRRTGISINHKNNQVTIEPGVLNGPLADELGKHGLAIAQGTCANVGVIGLCLGGGMGFLGRKYGLTCDNLVSFEILTANGKQLYVDKDNNLDLFWACRGAGNGNFGIITKMTLQAHYVPNVIIFEFRWTLDELYEILTIYFNWLRNNNSVGVEMDIFSLNIELPVMITGIYAGTRERLEKHLKIFLNTKPKYNKIWNATYTEAARHFTYARFPPPYFKNKSYYVYDNLPMGVVPIIEKYMKCAGPNDRIELNGLGSAYNNIKSHESAYIHRGALVWIQYIARYGTNSDKGVEACSMIKCLNSFNKTDEPSRKLVPGWEDEKIGPYKIAWVTSLHNEIKEAAGNIIRGAYVGCFDSDLKYYLEKYYGDNLVRLKKIKKKWDPDNKFIYPQSL